MTDKMIPLDSLRFLHTPKSIYSDYWTKIKRHGLITIPMPVAEIERRRIIEGIKKRKKLDYGFRCYCHIRYGYQLELVIDMALIDTQGTAIIKLKDSKQNNLLNLM